MNQPHPKMSWSMTTCLVMNYRFPRYSFQRCKNDICKCINPLLVPNWSMTSWWKRSWKGLQVLSLLVGIAAGLVGMYVAVNTASANHVDLLVVNNVQTSTTSVLVPTTLTSTSTSTQTVTSFSTSTSTLVSASTVIAVSTSTLTALNCPRNISLNFQYVPNSGYQAGMFIGYVGGCASVNIQIQQTPDSSICTYVCAGITVQYSNDASCNPTVNSGSHWWINDFAPCTNFSNIPSQYCSPYCASAYNKTAYSIFVSSLPADYIGIAGNNEDSVQVFGRS